MQGLLWLIVPLVFLVVLAIFICEQRSKDRCYNGCYTEPLSMPSDKNIQLPNASRRSAPRVLHQSGCEGSTFLQGMARTLMELHGNPPAKTPFEPFNPNDKDFIGLTHRDMSFATKAALLVNNPGLFYGFGIPYGTPVVFKSDAAFNLNGVLRVLQASGAFAVAILRSNVLDKLICSIRDCFKNITLGSGYSVDETGRPHENCMNRRGNSTPTLARVVTSRLLFALKNIKSSNNQRLKELKGWGFKSADVVSSEHLLDFEWSNKPEDLARAVEGWGRVLKALGIEPNAEIIRDYLQPLCGSRKQKSHKRSIYNFDDVQKALEGTQFSSFLRHEDFTPINPTCKCC